MQSSFLETTWTVTELTRRVRALLTGDPELRGLWVRGEVSNLSRPRSGHLYFTLKDANAALNCVIWRSQAARLPLRLRDGLQIEARGSVDVYEAGGRYQFYVDAVRPLGEGGLYEAFLRLKAQLEAEGLFDPAHKRPLPPLPRRIGVVTSATGAALQDILNTLRRRYPLATVVLSPALVQGAEAPASLVQALVRLMTRGQVDVIILARGGGSLEDLMAFNDEQVVRTVAASPVPVISGVGHETDFTLTDFAADLRAPTPTAAAELATPLTRAELLAGLEAAQRQLEQAAAEALQTRAADLDRWRLRLQAAAPQQRLREGRLRVDHLSARLEAAAAARLRDESLRLSALTERLAGLDPQAVLRRGYAILTRREDGRPVSSPQEVSPGLRLRAQVAGGEIPLVVEAETSDD